MDKKKQTKLTKIIITLLILFCFFVVLSTIVTAADEYQLLESLPGMGGYSAIEDGDHPAPGLGNYLTAMFYIGIGIAGVLAVIMITIGGLQYMTTEAISGKSGAKARINNAIFGLILALASFLLLKEINPKLSSPSLTIEPVKKPPAVTPPSKEVWGGMCTCSYINLSGIADEKITYVQGESGPICIANCEKFCGTLSSEYTKKITCKKTFDPTEEEE